jgi:hypothetical protein
MVNPKLFNPSTLQRLNGLNDLYAKSNFKNKKQHPQTEV